MLLSSSKCCSDLSINIKPPRQPVSQILQIRIRSSWVMAKQGVANNDVCIFLYSTRLNFLTCKTDFMSQQPLGNHTGNYYSLLPDPGLIVTGVCKHNCYLSFSKCLYKIDMIPKQLEANVLH